MVITAATVVTPHHNQTNMESACAIWWYFSWKLREKLIVKKSPLTHIQSETEMFTIILSSWDHAKCTDSQTILLNVCISFVQIWSILSHKINSSKIFYLIPDLVKSNLSVTLPGFYQ